MILIGENLNVISQTLGPALRERNAAPIEAMAKDETTAGVDLIDLNIGPARKDGTELLPWVVETVQSVTDRVREIIDDDRVAIKVVSVGVDPSPVSNPDDAPFGVIASTIRQVLQDDEMVITPYLVVGGTDAKYYSGRSSNVFRFLPVRMGEDDFERFHGTNERLSIENFTTSVRFFYQLIRNSDALGIPAQTD